MKRDIVWTTKFKKDYKLAIKRHMDIGLAAAATAAPGQQRSDGSDGHRAGK